MSTPLREIFVAAEVSDTGLQPLRDAGFVVEKRTKLSGPELRDALANCTALVVRSETKVTSDLMDCAATLRVVGRAGVGVDNIDVPAATERGIVVMNAPDGNTITTAEHTIALLIELAPLNDLFASADFITIHTPLTAETRGVIARDAFARMKRGVRIINCARGGLVDEAALYDAIKSGTVAGAALDVFAEEPPAPDHPLLLLDEVIATPHLGASTAEAQEGVAFTVAEQMRDYLLSGALRGAVNVPALGTKELAVLRPYIELAEKLGRFQAQLVDSAVREVKLEFAGEIVELNAAPVTRSFLAGLLRDVSARVNAVNAFLIAEERGISVTTSYLRASSDFVPSIRTRVLGNEVEQSLAGAIFGFGEQTREGRITE